MDTMISAAAIFEHPDRIQKLYRRHPIAFDTGFKEMGMRCVQVSGLNNFTQSVAFMEKMYLAFHQDKEDPAREDRPQKNETASFLNGYGRL